MASYPAYQESDILDWPLDNVLRITMSRGRVNAMDYDLHRDIAQIWRIIDSRPRGKCRHRYRRRSYFSAGGDFETDSRLANDYDFMIEMVKTSERSSRT